MEFAEATIHKSGNALFVTHGSDNGLHVEFSLVPVYQGFASEQAGRDIYKDVEHITIRTPGNGSAALTRPVRYEADSGCPPDPERFPKQWAAFQAQQEQVSEGTPLTEWPMLGKSQVMELKSKHIHTVEQLAAVSDTNLGAVGLGGREIREKAILWLSRATDGAAVAKVIADNKNLTAEIALLKKQMESLIGAQNKEASHSDISELLPEEAPVARPGRPRKTA